MSSKGLKYFIDETYFQSLDDEFGVKKIAEKFANAIKGKSEKEIEEIGKQVFDEYGKSLAKRILETEADNRDRTAEQIYEVAKKTGHIFPNVPQRMIEIGILATRVEDKWRWGEISFKRLSYAVTKCTMNQALIEAVGEKIANTLPCRHYCTALSETIYQGLNLDVGVRMVAELPKDKKCQFDGFFHFH